MLFAAIVVVLLELGVIVKFNVAVFKHPAAFIEVHVYAPDVVYAVPLHDQV